MLHRGLKFSAIAALLALAGKGMNDQVTFHDLHLLAEDDTSTPENAAERDKALAVRVEEATGAKSTAEASAAVGVGQAPAVDYKKLAAEVLRQAEERETAADVASASK